MSKTVAVVSSVEQIGISLGFSSRGRSRLSLSRSLAVVAVVTVEATIVPKTVSIVSKTISVSIVSVPRVSLSLGISSGGRSWLSLSRSLSIVVTIVAIMSKTVAIVSPIQQIGISLGIGNCLSFSLRLAHGEDGQAEKSQNPDHLADAEVGWKCPM